MTARLSLTSRPHKRVRSPDPAGNHIESATVSVVLECARTRRESCRSKNEVGRVTLEFRWLLQTFLYSRRSSHVPSRRNVVVRRGNSSRVDSPLKRIDERIQKTDLRRYVYNPGGETNSRKDLTGSIHRFA